MSQQTFEEVFEKLVQGVDLCLRARLVMPSLCLIYTTIDIAAWFNEGTEEVGRQFRAWCDQYLLPESGLPCTSTELYAARCGVLHTCSPKSRHTASGDAREIIYAWGDSEPEQLQELVDIGAMDGLLPIKVEDLFVAFVKGWQRFAGEVSADPTRAQVVHGRAQQVFRTMPKEERQALVDWGRAKLGEQPQSSS